MAAAAAPPGLDDSDVAFQSLSGNRGAGARFGSGLRGAGVG